MKPKATAFQPQRGLFRIDLRALVDPTHPLVKLGRQINWALFEEQLGKTYDPKEGNGMLEATATLGCLLAPLAVQKVFEAGEQEGTETPLLGARAGKKITRKKLLKETLGQVLGILWLRDGSSNEGIKREPVECADFRKRRIRGGRVVLGLQLKNQAPSGGLEAVLLGIRHGKSANKSERAGIVYPPEPALGAP